MSKISIIVPVYNVEKYLPQCLDSIINQTFTDFECICVNDGSPDNSLAILNEYAHKDKRIKVISQENRGLSFARNLGLKVVTGKYISFIDSDDFISKDFLEKLLTVAEKENSDIVYCKHKTYLSIDNKYKDTLKRNVINKLFFKYSKEKQLKHILSIVENARSVCMKLYKADVIKDNALSFFEKIDAEEDFSFNILANLYSKQINLLDEEIYFYRKQVKSLTTKEDTFRINAIKSFICLTKEMEKRNLLKDNKILEKFILSCFTFNIGKKIPKKAQQELYPVVYNHFLYLKNILKESCIKVCKINLYILIMKIFKTKSFAFFRMLKNI